MFQNLIKKLVFTLLIVVILTSCEEDTTIVEPIVENITEEKLEEPEDVIEINETEIIEDTDPSEIIEETDSPEVIIIEQSDDPSQDSLDEESQLYFEALDTLNVSICRNMDTPGSAGICEMKVLLENALKKNDVNICDLGEIEQLQLDCRDRYYMNLAINAKDESLCDKIEQEYVDEYCRDETPDPIQSILPLPKEDYQISIEAVSELDYDGCDEISDSQIMNQCQEDVYLEITLRSNTTDHCDSITDESQKAKCSDYIIFKNSFSVVDETICDEIVNQTLRETCILYQGPSYLDSTDDCETFSVQVRTQCFDFVHKRNAILEKDTSHCENIIDSNTKSDCIEMLKVGSAFYN